MPRKGPLRLVVIGLDGAVPAFVFDRFRSALPALSALAATAITGELESTIPATTLPAWPCMFSGRDPGEIGIYGARQRFAPNYAVPPPVTSRLAPSSTLWDAVGQAGESSIVIGAPPGYPPRPLRGVAVSCAVTPPDAATFTYPADLGARLRAGGYEFDLREPAGTPAAVLLDHAALLTRRRFGVFRELLAAQSWQLAILIDPTLDRLQHALWHDVDALQQHYAVIDQEVGQLLAALDPTTIVAVLSDHGARASRGSFAVNDWLRQEGFLTLTGRGPADVVPLDRADVDWSRTLAWAEGGPAVRIMLNVQGREPQGTVEPRRYEQVRNDIKRRLEALGGPDGKTMGNHAYKPEEIYQATHRVAPDLVCTLGGMAFRATGSLGHPELFVPPVLGVSSGNHAERGLFMLRWPQHGPNGRREGIRALDVHPTLLTTLGLPLPDGLGGRALVG